MNLHYVSLTFHYTKKQKNEKFRGPRCAPFQIRLCPIVFRNFALIEIESSALHARRKYAETRSCVCHGGRFVRRGIAEANDELQDPCDACFFENSDPLIGNGRTAIHPSRGDTYARVSTGT